MDMRKLSSICDWFILVSAESTRRVDTISKNIQEELHKQHVRPLHVEGRQGATWVLLDYGEIVVHIFHKDTRGFYNLEHLWGKAPREHVDTSTTAKRRRLKRG